MARWELVGLIVAVLMVLVLVGLASAGDKIRGAAWLLPPRGDEKERRQK